MDITSASRNLELIHGKIQIAACLIVCCSAPAVLFEMRPLQVEAHGVALANLGRSLLGALRLLLQSCMTIELMAFIEPSPVFN